MANQFLCRGGQVLAIQRGRRHRRSGDFGSGCAGSPSLSYFSSRRGSVRSVSRASIGGGQCPRSFRRGLRPRSRTIVLRLRRRQHRWSTENRAARRQNLPRADPIIWRDKLAKRRVEVSAGRCCSVSEAGRFAIGIHRKRPEESLVAGPEPGTAHLAPIDHLGRPGTLPGWGGALGGRGPHLTRPQRSRAAGP